MWSKHKILILLHHLRLNGPKGTLYWSRVVKAKQVHSIYPSFKYTFKGLEKKFTLRYLTSNYLGQQLGQRACVLGSTPLCKSQSLFFFFLIFIFIYLLLAVLGLCFCARAFSSCGKRGPLFIAVRGPYTITASLVAEHRLQTRRLSSCGSRA